MNTVKALAIRLGINEQEIDSFDFNDDGSLLVIDKSGKEYSLVRDRNYYRLFRCEFGHQIAASLELRLKSTEHIQTWGLFADECFATIAKAEGYDSIHSMIAMLESANHQRVLETVMCSWGSPIPDKVTIVATGKTRKEWLQVEKIISRSFPRVERISKEYSKSSATF